MNNNKYETQTYTCDELLGPGWKVEGGIRIYEFPDDSEMYDMYGLDVNRM
jgi:hypothetical protein